MAQAVMGDPDLDFQMAQLNDELQALAPYLPWGEGPPAAVGPADGLVPDGRRFRAARPAGGARTGAQGELRRRRDHGRRRGEVAEGAGRAGGT